MIFGSKVNMNPCSCLIIGYTYCILSLWIQCVISTRITGPEEFCTDEIFNGICEENEVIGVKAAKYGRMKIGKCVKEDMGFLGCSIDVISTLQSTCSGRSRCAFDVRDLYKLKPCRELAAYLAVTYECIPVVSFPPEVCARSPALTIPNSHGYISSYVAKKSGCGSMAHPLHIAVTPGQRVEFNIHSFATDNINSPSKNCKSLGYISEVGHRDNVSICSKNGGKEHLYTSNGRNVRVYVNTGTVEETGADFILHYKVFGCTDISVGPGAWYRREGDSATVGCEHQDTQWQLTCQGDTWSGVMGNCTQNIAASIQRSSSDIIFGLDFQTLLIICIAVVFVILIVIAGVVIVWKWRESSQHKPPSTVLLQEEQYRLNKGPLPPVPENSSHYRSLIRQPDPQAFPQHSQTMPRPPPQQDIQEGDDYSADWRFGTAPWQKQGLQTNQNQA